MNQVDSLKICCCRSIVNDDNVEILQPVIDMLPMDIIEYLLAIMNDFQFSRFHGSYASGLKFERLFAEHYKKLERDNIDSASRLYLAFSVEYDLCKICVDYWNMRVAAALLKEKREQIDLIFKICTKDPHLVQAVNATNAKNATLDLLPRFTNVRRLTFEVHQKTKLEKMYALARSWKMLQEIILKVFDESTLLWQSLKQFLDLKIQNNERVMLTLNGTFLPKNQKYTFYDLSGLGDAIHGISGLTLDHPPGASDFREWLETYSRVRCINKLDFRFCDHFGTSLLNITKHAPAYTSNDDALSKLIVTYIKGPLSLYNYIAFQHWRFSKLEYFHMWYVNIGQEGAMLLAKYATFWPFVKHCIFHKCDIPSEGFLLLLPAMIRGKGCEKLVNLDVHRNGDQTATFEAFTKFLNFKSFANLKYLAIFRLNCESPSTLCQLLATIQKLPLVKLDMSDIIFTLEQFHQFLNTMLSKSTHQLQEIRVCVPAWFTGNKDQHHIDLNNLLKNYDLSCLQSNQFGLSYVEQIHYKGKGKFMELLVEASSYC